MFYYHPVIEDISKDFLDSQAKSRRIQLQDIKVGLIGSVWDAVLRLIAPFV